MFFITSLPFLPGLPHGLILLVSSGLVLLVRGGVLLRNLPARGPPLLVSALVRPVTLLRPLEFTVFGKPVRPVISPRPGPIGPVSPRSLHTTRHLLPPAGRPVIMRPLLSLVGLARGPVSPLRPGLIGPLFPAVVGPVLAVLLPLVRSPT